ncbi:MAG: rhomboid family intramembrane serine protease [Chloroflexi bacterium]|nr:rhomboid family intramembrane serine protease [Chloroflexota bacterium]
MIPIGDDTPRRRPTVVNWILIALNVIVWLYEALLSGPALNRFISTAALIPARITVSPDLPSVFTLLSAMFMHASWQHIIGNMLYLAIFGDNIEDHLGHVAYLLFYLAGGVIASLVQVAVDPSSEVPILGASGAIASVLGAYLVLFPRQRVKGIIVILGFIRITTLPALLVLGFWFILQLFNGAASVVTSASGGTAWFAHVGGFVYGLLIGLVTRRKQHDQPSPYFVPR